MAVLLQVKQDPQFKLYNFLGTTHLSNLDVIVRIMYDILLSNIGSLPGFLLFFKLSEILRISAHHHLNILNDVNY